MTTMTTAPTHELDVAIRLCDLPGHGARMLPVGGPAWLADVRARALDRFADLELPTTANEAWRETNIAPIEKGTYFLRHPERTMSEDELAGLCVDVPGAIRLVLIDGVLSAQHSDLSGLPDGVEVLNIFDAAAKHRALIEPRLERTITDARDGFAALGTALLRGGLFVYANKGVTCDRPIVLTHVSTEEGGASATGLFNLIIAEPQARVTVVEDYVSAGDAPSLMCVLSEIDAGDAARVDHYMLERESTEAFQIGMLRTRQGRDTTINSHIALLGGRIVRNDVNPVLAGTGAHGMLNGLFVAGGRQHHDNHMHVVHEAAHCDSRQYYRGLLDDESRGVFTGRIVVVQDAQKTDAIQSNNNILLSPKAQVNTRPQLEIYADDVRCTHGATIGQLNTDAMFYLRARGLDEPTARMMLLFAFVGETLDRMELEPVREAVRREVERRILRLPSA